MRSRQEDGMLGFHFPIASPVPKILQWPMNPRHLPEKFALLLPQPGPKGWELVFHTS